MSGVPITVAHSNLSVAWCKALLHVLDHSAEKCPPLVVSIGGFASPLPSEDKVIRDAVDGALTQRNCNRCSVSAMVVFPYKPWLSRQSLSCDDFSRFCVDRLLPRLKALDQRNHHGTYFERLMAYRCVKDGAPIIVNQLSEVVDRLKGPKRFRATGLQMTCFNPASDHSRQPRLGFPCLQHVGITYEGKGGLAVTGFYPSQHIFDRAYGNYLGLVHLGSFLAHQASLTLKRVNCIATRPMLGSDVSKGDLVELRAIIEQRLKVLDA